MASDGILTFSVYRQHEKPWVAELMVPYLVFFGVASVVSSFTFVQKCKLVVDKFRRQRADSNDAAEVQVETLEEKLDAKKMEIRKIYCVLLLGATEGAHCAFERCPGRMLCQRLCCQACASSDFASRLQLTKLA